MKKHLQVKDLALLLADPGTTMGEDTYLVVVLDGKEYPVVGAESYDGVFCSIVLGAEMTEENQLKIERRGDENFVVVEDE